eukprot:gene11911-15936_t
MSFSRPSLLLTGIRYCTLLLLACTGIITPYPSSVNIIGATSILGQSIIDQIITASDTMNIIEAYGSYKDQSKTKLLLKQMQSYNPIANQKSSLKFKLYEFDSLKSYNEDIPGFGACSNANHHILICCSAICLEGISNDIMRSTLQINTITPILLKISNEIEKIMNISDLEIMISNFLQVDYNSLDSHPSAIAHSTTPIYSLSKALLNKGMSLLHNNLDNNNIRFVSICPGNFKSPISSMEELADYESMVDVKDAAKDILDIAFNYDKYPGGLFYRNGQVINF